MSAMRVRSASWVFAWQVLARGVGFVSGIILARALGASGKGAFTVVQTVNQTAVLIFGLGLSPALLFYVARGQADGRSTRGLALALAAVVAAVLLGAYTVIGEWLAVDVLGLPVSGLLALGIALVAPALVMNLLYALVSGSGSVRAATTVLNASLVGQLAAYAALYLLDRLTLGAALWVWGASVVAEAIGFWWLSHRVTAARGTETGAPALLRRAWRYGAVAWLSSLVGFAALRADVYLLSAFKGTAEVGVYSIAVSFAELCWFVPNALQAVMLPKVAGEGDETLELSLRLERVLWPLTVLIAVSICVLALPLIPVLYGADFVASRAPLLLLMPGVIAIALSSVPSAYLSGLGRPQEWTKAAGVNLVVNIALNVILIPRYGAAGAAIASSVSYSLAAVVIIFAFLRITRSGVRALLLPSWGDITGFISAASRVLRREG